MKKLPLLLTIGIVLTFSGCAPDSTIQSQYSEWSNPAQATISVNAEKILRIGNRHLLIGSNIAVWNAPEAYQNTQIQQWLRELDIGALRMPGGSWSNLVYWNGNGPRNEEGDVDHSKMKDNYPDIDYSHYAPSILVDHSSNIRPGDWHGNIDVKAQHEYITSILNCSTIVSVNAGTARAKDAAEWVRWANLEMDYKVKYWEIGNEPEGTWEAGHYLPDGSEITGEIYAERFKEFAIAMKAIDPSIKIGGPVGGSSVTGFGEALLRDAGDYVDFYSWHTYPLRTTLSREEMLQRADKESFQTVNRIRNQIRRYQPDKADDMELMLTEWNLSLEGGMEADMFGARWSALFIGNLFESGVTMANHWDAFSHRQAGSLFDYPQDNDRRKTQRKAQYWAFWLWSHFMGNQVLAYELDGPGFLKVFATRNEDAVYIMAINFHDDREIRLTPEIGNFKSAETATTALLSPGQVFWNDITKQMEWSTPPQIQTVSSLKETKFTIPPASIMCIQIPGATQSGPSELIESQPIYQHHPDRKPEYRFILDQESFEDTNLEGWLLAFEKDTDLPYKGKVPKTIITVNGNAEVDRKTIRMSESAGHFTLTPKGPGKVVVQARIGNETIEHAVLFKPTIPRPQRLWEFEMSELDDRYSSDWTLKTDASIKPNQRVARIDMIPTKKEDKAVAALILDFKENHDKKSIIGNIDKKNIRGVFFEIMTSKDFKCDDPEASIEIIMQSPSDYWMNIADFPVSELDSETWKTMEFSITNEKHLLAIPQVYNIWIVLQTESATPEGALFIDNVGLMVR